MLRKTLPYLYPFLLGLITCLGMPPWDMWYMTLIGFALFYRHISSQKLSKKSAIKGYLFGFGYFLFGLYWIGNAIFIHWDDYWWAYPLALLGIPLFLAGFWGAASYLTVKFSKTRSAERFFLFLFCFSTFEWIRGWLFTGFPWNLPGYAWSNILGPDQLAAIGGIYYLTLWTILWGALIGHISISKMPLKLSIVLITTFTIPSTLGIIETTTIIIRQADKHAFLIVQPNINQADKWKAELIPDHIHKLLELSTHNPQKHPQGSVEKIYILWPETAISKPYLDHPTIKAKIKETLSTWPIEAELITGALHFEKETGNYYNSIYRVNKEATNIERYNKSHLVPFGEYIPFVPEDILMPLNVASFTPGEKGQPFKNKDHTLFPLICYEIIFPEQLANIERDTKSAIITVTNDAWYNDAPGPYQHHAMAKFRAIEQGMPVFRSANTGISGAFDFQGNDLGHIAYGKADSLYITSPLTTNETLYAKYGNLIFYISLLMTLLPVAIIKVRQRLQ